MIDLAMIERWGTTALALIFLGLWLHSERQQTKALEVAAMSVETTAACVASYNDSADAIGAAVQNLTIGAEVLGP